MNDYRERIKRRLPPGYDRLFGDGHATATDHPLRDEDGPPAVRHGRDGPANQDDAIRPTDRDGPAAHQSASGPPAPTTRAS